MTVVTTHSGEGSSMLNMISILPMLSDHTCCAGVPVATVMVTVMLLNR